MTTASDAAKMGESERHRRGGYLCSSLDSNGPARGSGSQNDLREAWRVFRVSESCGARFLPYGCPQRDSPRGSAVNSRRKPRMAWKPSLTSRRRALTTAAALVLTSCVGVACHPAPPPPPPREGFAITDKFFDVKSLGNNSFLLLGYRSALARSDDGGQTWKKLAAPTRRNLTRLAFADGKRESSEVAASGRGELLPGLSAVVRSREGAAVTEQEEGIVAERFDVEELVGDRETFPGRRRRRGRVARDSHTRSQYECGCRRERPPARGQ